MRRLIFFSMLALVLSSCSNVAQFKEPVETLINDWEATTGKIMTVMEQITQMQNAATTTLNAMSPSEEIFEQMNDDQKATLSNLVQQVQLQVGSLGNTSKKAFEFVNKWQQGGEQLSTLNDGISNGELPENPEAMIKELQGLLSTGNTNIENWTNQTSAAKEAINSATQGYTSLMESFSAAVAE